MSTNLFKRSVAVGSAFALAGAALTAAPAVAAEGDVTLAPAGGLNYGSFSTESFSLAANYALGLDEEQLAFEIVNPDQQALRIELLEETGSADIADETANTSAKVIGFNSLGVQVDLDDKIGDSSSGGSNIADPGDAEFIIDFAGLAITRAVIYDFTTDGAKRAAIKIQPLLDNATSTDNSAAGALPTDNGSGLDPYAYGDGTPASVTVRSWIETERVADFETVDTVYASPSRTVTFVDPAAVSLIPRIERFEHSGGEEINNSGQTSLAASIQFSDSSLNLDQITTTNLKFKIAEDGTSSASVGQVETAIGTSSSVRDRLGFSSKDKDGKMYVELTAQANLDPGKEYVASFKYNASTAPFFASTGFTPPTSTDPGLLDVDVVALDTVNSNQASNSNAITLNTATKAFTYEGQIEDTADGTAQTDASVPILFSVQAGAFLSADNTYTVSGATEIISNKNQIVYGTGFTDSDGEFRVTVTASNPTADDSYKVAMYVLGDDDTFKRAEGDYTASYDASIGGTLTPDSSVLSGETVTASFTVTDQFEQATNTRLGSQLRVSLEASNTDNLDLDADVAADGTVSFTFDNYVVAGSSDVVTAKLYTGSSVAAGTVRDTKTLSLYNASNVASINVPAALTGEVSYVDFIEGKATTANPAPSAGKVDLTGTAVDSNGTGVPGAVVTIAADGAQFLSGTTYSMDSVTVAASASGVFDVDVWFTELNKTGIDVTVTSGTATATSTVKTYLPTGLDGDNLIFSLNMPANVVMNQTYAVTATLTDKHGNPVQTTGSNGAVEIIGTGSVQINSVNTAADKNFGKDGTTTVFLRSIKDIAGPGAVTATLQTDAKYKKTASQSDQTLAVTEQTVDVTTTAFDETSFVNEISTNVEVYETAADVPASSSGDTKVNAGSFKGYVAVYAKGYEGQRLSAKIGNDWVIVPSLASNFERIVDFTGAGVDIAVRIYIDRVLMDTINLTTK